MASKRRQQGARPLAWLLVLITVLLGGNAAAIIWGDGELTPNLALDLEGGRQIILAPQLEEGESVTNEQLSQAVSIIRQRVNASGVSEAEITTQGNRNIVVSLPGTPDAETMQRIQASAKMEFRPVLVVGTGSGAPVPSSDGAEAEGEEATAPEPTDASDLSQVTPEIQEKFDTLVCADIDNTVIAPEDEVLVTCSNNGTERYILGPVEVEGAQITDATAGPATSAQGISTGGWAVNLQFNNQGTDEFYKVTQRITSLEEPRNRFAVVLDGTVIIAPSSNAIISDGRAQITGGFTQEQAQSLADQLKFGALPIGFIVQSNEQISATLGSTQLQAGMIAGLIGLILVVVYSFFQYRALALVTIASLLVAALMTYLVINLLSATEGYRLSLAGVAGLIVAIGITADSFIVYFERVRDELRDGRVLSAAVEAGWKRALRTIIASDTINFLAAIILFILAVGNVQGFALTLGLTTVIDLIVVSLFTHPMLKLLARTNFFASGHPASGLNPDALGAVYRGRAQFRQPTLDPKKKGARGEAARRQSIAERKAASHGEKVSVED
ncbi:protein translocase subunit SecD [Humidisolicoccus flavus]|uniref:protein translocase subunit SecD n=1 Tax=Humidisolicoccus flavus TaxID=3111414 RepID=UPI003252E280